MKIRLISIIVVACWLIGVGFITRSFVQQEEDARIEDTINKGNHLVSLLALYPTLSFEGDKRDFLLRTLTEYTYREGLVYLLVHDLTRNRVVSLAPQDLLAKMPKDIETRSLYSTGLLQQAYELNDPELTIYEFAKPIYESGRRTGTVRLGLKLPAVSVFSAKRISLWTMVAFFIIATLLCGYYGFTLLLRPLKDLNKDFQGTKAGSGLTGIGLMKDVQIVPMVKSVEQSLTELKAKLNKIEQDNLELASKLGVLSFEKNQIVNILNSLDLGIIITDIQDNIIHINSFMLTLLNRTLEDAIDRPLGDVIEYAKISNFIAQEGSLGSTKSKTYIETTFPAVDPEETFQVSLSHLSDDGGGIIGKIILVRNVSKEKTAQSANNEFITHVAHELRTPLTTIKSYNEMLMTGEIDDKETQKEFFNTINEETDRVARLIENLLNVSKIEMGSLTLNKTLIKTDRIFEDCIGAVEAPAYDKHITLEKKMPDKFPTLYGDKELLKVALINVLGNAVKYTPEAGTVIFELAEQDNAVVFDVIDTGCGISKEDISRIFNKFYRSEDSKVTEQTGSGLGLSITSEIIHLHGGKIEVQSELGNGTHFTITVPKEQYYLEEQ